MNFEQELNRTTENASAFRNSAFGIASPVVRTVGKRPIHSHTPAHTQKQQQHFKEEEGKNEMYRKCVATLKNNMQFITLNARTIPQIIHRN